MFEVDPWYCKQHHHHKEITVVFWAVRIIIQKQERWFGINFWKNSQILLSLVY